MNREKIVSRIVTAVKAKLPEGSEISDTTLAMLVADHISSIAESEVKSLHSANQARITLQCLKASLDILRLQEAASV